MVTIVLDTIFDCLNVDNKIISAELAQSLKRASKKVHI